MKEGGWSMQNMASSVGVGISYAQVEYSTSTQNTVVAFHQGAFQGIVIYLIPRESGSQE